MMKTKIFNLPGFVISANIVITLLSYGCKKEEPPVPTYYLPEVATVSMQSITTTTAHFNGRVISDGNATVTSRGFKVSTNPSNNYTGDLIYCGSGTGTFSGDIQGLSPNTPYYVWAFATNSVGTDWGEPMSFNTVNDVTYDLNGVWDRGDIEITISGISGTFSEINSGSWLNALNRGYAQLGWIKICQIAKVSSTSWSCNELWNKTDGNGNVTETAYSPPATITISTDGNTITVNSSDPWNGSSSSTTYTRKSGGGSDLNGVWDAGDFETTIVGASGTFSEITANPWLSAKNGGYISIGHQFLKNITLTGSNTWSCDVRWAHSTNGVVDDVFWSSLGTITLSYDDTFFTLYSEVTYNGNFFTQSGTLTRKGKGDDKRTSPTLNTSSLPGQTTCGWY
ncbi:MAG: hypothetical protein V1775_03710 [Bacteroidota bacterium]